MEKKRKYGEEVGGVLKGRKWEWLFSPNSDVSATPISG